MDSQADKEEKKEKKRCVDTIGEAKVGYENLPDS